MNQVEFDGIFKEYNYLFSIVDKILQYNPETIKKYIDDKFKTGIENNTDENYQMLKNRFS